MSKSRSQLHAKALPPNVTRALEDLALDRIRTVLGDQDDVTRPKGLSRIVFDGLLPIISEALTTARAQGHAEGKREVEGRVTCQGCGFALVYRAAGSNPGWMHLRPMARVHPAVPRDRVVKP